LEDVFAVVGDVCRLLLVREATLVCCLLFDEQLLQLDLKISE